MTSLLLFIYLCIYSYYKVMLTDDKQFFFIFENEIKQNINFKTRKPHLHQLISVSALIPSINIIF